MPKKGRFDFTKKNKRSGKIENVGYLDLEQDEEQSRCSLYFYGDIVSATWESMWYEEDRCPQDITDFLNQLDGYEDIDIYFNSGGGDVFAGLAIYNQLKRYDGHKVGYVDGMAASIASVIMFAYGKDSSHGSRNGSRYGRNSSHGSTHGSHNSSNGNNRRNDSGTNGTQCSYELVSDYFDCDTDCRTDCSRCRTI